MWYSVSLLVMINFKEHSLSLKLTKILLRNNDAVISTLILMRKHDRNVFKEQLAHLQKQKISFHPTESQITSLARSEQPLRKNVAWVSIVPERVVR